MRHFLSCSLALSTIALASPYTYGQAPGDLQITFTNNLSTDGFFFTPVWIGFQDGENGAGSVFDQFDLGAAADSLLPVNSGSTPQSPIEAIAEDGIVDGLVEAFATSGVPGNRQGVIANPAGFGGAPVIDPGETGTAFITPINTANYQYLSFASMLIPSNDTFIGNDSTELFKVFNADGSLVDPDGDGQVVFEIFASELFDAGTEDNDGLGAAFSTAGGTATPTLNGLVSQTIASDLSTLIGISTPAGNTISQGDIDLLFAGGPIATITVSVVPEPTSLGLLGVCGFGVAMRRRRR